MADFDRDGIPDVLAGAPSLQGVTAWLGTGGGEFGPANFTAIPTVGGRFVVGDFDEDGFPDITDGSQILFGGGSGRFGPGVPLPRTGVAAVGDFDGDGHLDIAVSRGPLLVSLMLGDGHGNMNFAGDFPTGIPDWDHFQGLSAGRLDGDAYSDLVFGSGSNFSLLRGGPSGFTAPTLYPFRVDHIRIVDLDGDGNNDVVGVGTTVQFFRGNGTGQLLPPQSIAMGSPPFTNFLQSFQIADLNGDGILDLTALEPDPEGSAIRFRLGTGSGNFGPVRQLVMGAFEFALADLNGDGFPDYVFLSSNSVFVAFNDGTGGIENHVFPGVADPSAFVAADFNGDGKLDIAVGRYRSPPGDSLSIFLGNGAGGLSSGTLVPGSGSVGTLAAIDINGDGKKDLVGADYFASPPWRMLNDGTGGFGPKIPIAGACGSQFPVASADLNHDGHQDLVFTCVGGIAVLLGDGAGGFPTLITIPTDYANSLAIEDVDGDGNLDIVGSGRTISGVATHRGDGTGHFGPPIVTTTYTVGNQLVLADFNGDGNIDVAQSVFANGTFLSVMFGDGSGSFAAPLLFPRDGVTALTVMDLNGDGRPDLVAPYGDVEILMNDGTGQFLAPQELLSGASGLLAVGDFDGDGKPDLATAGNGLIAILANTSCIPRRLRVVPRFPACIDPGAAITPSVEVQMIDDGGNPVCSGTGSVAVSLLAGPPGTVLGGTTTKIAPAGTATFDDLTLSRSGRSRLQFTHSGGAKRTEAFFSIGSGITVAIAGPGTVCGSTPAVFEAGPGYTTYLWTLDGVPISSVHTAMVGYLAAGPHTIAVRVSVGGCEAETSRTIMNAPPQVLSVSPASGPSGGGNLITVTGACFESPATLSLGGTDAYPVSVSGPTSLTGIPAGHGPGGVSVDVKNPDGQVGTLAGGYTYICAVTPTAVVSGDVTVCAGTTAHLLVRLTGEPPWILNWSDGQTTYSNYSGIAQRYAAASSTTTFSLVSATGNFCPAILSGSATVTVEACPAGTPSGTLIPDGRVTEDVMRPEGNVYSFQPTDSNYSIEVETLGFGGAATPAAAPAPVVFATRSSGAALTYPSEDRSGCSPAGSGRLLLFVDYLDLADGPIQIRVHDPLASGYRFRIHVAESMMYAARYSINGYRAFVDLQNSSDCVVEGYVVIRSPEGYSENSRFISLPPGGSVQFEIDHYLSYFQKIGSLALYHDGPPGALSGGVYMVTPAGGNGANFRFPFQEVRTYGAADAK